MRKIDDVIERLRAEYLAMPGLRLKPEQVRRLCGIERAMCETALHTLVSAKFLSVSADGRYACVQQRRLLHPPLATADPKTDARSREAS
jgi:hypothetical protein